MVDLEIPLSAALGMLHQFQLNLVREEWDFVKEALKVIDPMYKITREFRLKSTHLFQRFVALYICCLSHLKMNLT